jgi:2-polyprenyl-3-methyl-5-hydroxy-6-metoxy-1,4-benzoquinol methylase
MSTDTLPPREAEILKKIRKKHKVAFEPFKIRGLEIQLLKVQDLESVLRGKDPFKNVSEFPFWIKLWESAMILADVAVTLPLDSGARILELGAGLGAPGLAAAAKGFSVTLSDYEQTILDFQRVSAAKNGLEVDITFFDWNTPPNLEPFEVVLGAEILFREELVAPLMNVFEKLLKPGGTIYLAHDIRRQTLYKFLDMAKDQYKIMAKKITLSGNEEEVTVMLNCLKRK